MKSYYLDTGVIVTPLLKNQEGSIIEQCREWLERIARGEVQAKTSFLTWDEVIWVAGKGAEKVYNRARAVKAGELLLSLKNLEFVPVDEAVIRGAQQLIARFGLKPRDCIHASSALLHAQGELVSLDSGFWKEPTLASSAGLKVTEIVTQLPPTR
ncbi:MAG TPA: type II toxin-antitoxin system VapC family toxin [Myxococcaceae bacterium]|jgi:predicted nucleic acid-binding protein